MDVRSYMERAARTWPDREAVVEGERRLTYGQAWDRGLRLANLMRAGGLRAQDRVAVIEDNTLEAVDFYLACAIGNFIRVPLYARNSTESHQHMMSHTGCAGLVAAEKYLPEVGAGTRSLRFLLVRDGGYEDTLSAAAADSFDDPVAENDIFIIRHTAGTSGTSKGVAYTHRKWITIMRDWLFPWPPLEVGDAFLHQSPISHGSGYFFTPAWVSGARNVMLPKADPSLILATIERERITHLLGIPTIIASIVRHPDVAACDLSSVKALTVSGAPMDESTARQAHKVFGDVLYTGFGQTEINPVTFMNAREWPAALGWPRSAARRTADSRRGHARAASSRRNGRDRGAHRRAVRRILGPAGGDRRAHQGRLGPHRRHGLPGQGGLPLHPGPGQRHDHLWRVQHLPRGA
jgi:acyl-CoA synthetase (AMP-forming)/AMP-acid ligase II